jgi:hypothetical protein
MFNRKWVVRGFVIAVLLYMLIMLVYFTTSDPFGSGGGESTKANVKKEAFPHELYKPRDVADHRHSGCP